LTSSATCNNDFLILQSFSIRISMPLKTGCMGETRGVYRVLVGKPEGNRPLGRPRRRWKDYIKVNLQEVGCEGMDRIDLAQGGDWWRALVKVVMNFRVPLNAGNFLTS
jgi:hypothetical protein